MRLQWIYVIFGVVVCASVFCEIQVSEVQEFEKQIAAFIELTELEYEEKCFETAQSEWEFINEPTNQTFANWATAQYKYSIFKKKQQDEILNETNNVELSSTLSYKRDAATKLGDALLEEENWKQFVTFAGQAEVLRASAKYTDKTKKLSQQDVEHLLSQSGDVDKKRDAWASWHQELAPLLPNFPQQIQLIHEAAKANGEKNVSHYWELLSAYPNGYEKLEYAWNEISSLHKKIRNFVHTRLVQKYKIVSENESIPAYLLGSLQGNDWIAIAGDVMPNSNLTFEIRKNLWKKNLMGPSLYKTASTLGKITLNTGLGAEFFKNSQFDKKCPAKLINFCKLYEMGVSTCFDASLSNYLTAHKMVAKVVVNHLMAESSPVLNIANRYSALEEGIAELFAILSVSPARLRSLGLVASSNDTEQLEIESLMITALDVLPRLAYYMTADLWRINVLRNGINDSKDLIASWWKYRLEYEGVVGSAVSDIPTFLADSYITGNKPYLSKFVGTVLAFQFYEYLMSSTEVRYDSIKGDPANHMLVKMFQDGGADDWTTVISKYLKIEEVESNSLLSYFSRLEDYIDEKRDKDEEKYGSIDLQEAELEQLEEYHRIQFRSPSTTTTTTTTTSTTTTTAVPSVKELDSKYSQSDSTESKSSPSKSLDIANNPSNIQADTSEAKDTSSSIKVNKNVSETLNVNELESEADTKNKPKINTSKAVWAVLAVLVATVTICLITIFGRSRCRETPKNRRYV